MNAHKLLVICLAASLMSLGAVAQTPPALQATVSIGEQFPLLSQSGGIVNTVIQEALKRGGYSVQWDWLPIGRMLKSLEDDRLEVYVTPSNTPGQQYPHLDFLSARGVFFFLKSRYGDFKVGKLEDLAGKRVATVTNSPLKTAFEKAGIIVDEGPFDTMFTKLESGRVDFTSTADVGGILTIRKLFPGREDEFSSTDFSYTEIRTALYDKNGKTSPGLLEAAKKGFESMKKDGSLEHMLKEFFGAGQYRKVKVY